MNDWLTWNILENKPVRAGVTRGRLWSRMARQSGASQTVIKEERARYCRKLNLSENAFFSVSQVHSSRCHKIESRETPPREADALMTDKPGYLLNIFTADCLSVVLYDPGHRAAAVIHAGWKGSVQGICRNTVRAMKDRYKSEPSEILACFGPSIGTCCYEVRNDMKQKALEMNRDAAGFFINRNSRIYFDLEGYNRAVLAGEGILQHHTESLSLCTSCSDEHFPSWRRDRGKCGRLVTSVLLT